MSNPFLTGGVIDLCKVDFEEAIAEVGSTFYYLEYDAATSQTDPIYNQPKYERSYKTAVAVVGIIEYTPGESKLKEIGVTEPCDVLITVAAKSLEDLSITIDKTRDRIRISGVDYNITNLLPNEQALARNLVVHITGDKVVLT